MRGRNHNTTTIMDRNYTQLKYLPVLCFVWMLATFITSYAIATSLDHVYPLFPYISDTGTIPPESCIFGLMLNITSVFMAMVLYIRYQQIRIILKTHESHNKFLNIINFFCLITGMLAAFGAAVVANFQETSNMTVHLLGANLCFGVGSGYFIFHTLICFFVNRDMLALNLLRVFLCFVSVITFATTMIFAKMSFQEYDVSVHGALLWNSDKPGYSYRLASTFSEWTLGLTQGFYILTLAYDFRNIKYNLHFALNKSPDDDRETSYPVA